MSPLSGPQEGPDDQAEAEHGGHHAQQDREGGEARPRRCSAGPPPCPRPASSATPSVTSVTGLRRRRGGGGGVAGPGLGQVPGERRGAERIPGRRLLLVGGPVLGDALHQRYPTGALLGLRRPGLAGLRWPATPRSARLRCNRNSSTTAASSGRMNPPRPPKTEPIDTMVAITKPTTKMAPPAALRHRRVLRRVGKDDPPGDVERGPDPENAATTNPTRTSTGSMSYRRAIAAATPAICRSSRGVRAGSPTSPGTCRARLSCSWEPAFLRPVSVSSGTSPRIPRPSPDVTRAPGCHDG